MTEFSTRLLPLEPDVVAPDGSDVRVILRTGTGSMAHFELAAGRASDPIRHRTVEEIWYVLAGSGEMWRRQGEKEEVAALVPGTCVTIPLGTHFQFRAAGTESLSAVGVTMPPWPGDHEAIPVAGKWPRARDERKEKKVKAKSKGSMPPDFAGCRASPTRYEV